MEKELVMQVSVARQSALSASRWSLTSADVVLCIVPVALFLSIVSLV